MLIKHGLELCGISAAISNVGLLSGLSDTWRIYGAAVARVVRAACRYRDLIVAGTRLFSVSDIPA